MRTEWWPGEARGEGSRVNNRAVWRRPPETLKQPAACLDCASLQGAERGDRIRPARTRTVEDANNLA